MQPRNVLIASLLVYLLSFGVYLYLQNTLDQMSMETAQGLFIIIWTMLMPLAIGVMLTNFGYQAQFGRDVFLQVAKDHNLRFTPGTLNKHPSISGKYKGIQITARIGDIGLWIDGEGGGSNRVWLLIEIEGKELAYRLQDKGMSMLTKEGVPALLDKAVAFCDASLSFKTKVLKGFLPDYKKSILMKVPKTHD